MNPARRAPLCVAPGEVHLWVVRLEASTGELDALAGLLEPQERRRADRFHFARDRNRFLAGRARLRILLGRYLGIPPGAVRFRYGLHGKPSLAGREGDLQFNVSHSGALALVGLARSQRIGVDVERLRPGPLREKVADRFFSARERASLRSLPPEQRLRAFFHGWTRKEALLKAIGEGLGFGLDRCSVSLGPGEAARILEMPAEQGSPSRWSVRHLEPAPGYVGAVVVEGPIDRLSVFDE